MKKNWLFWLPVGAAAVWAGSHLLPGFGHLDVFGGQGHEMMKGGAMMQGGHGGGKGMMGGHDFGGKHGFGFHFGWTKAVIGAGAALLGITLRKNAGDTAWKKWAGYGLIAAGLVTIFKPILPIVAIGAGAYWLFKKAGSSKEEFSAVDYTVPVTSGNAAALDAWEQNISKEEK